jgi:hypothetical protein
MAQFVANRCHVPVRWNGAVQPTTVVGSTQVQASIDAANVTSAGTVAVTVANLGLSAAPSNALPFFISSSAPTASEPRRLLLPLMRR